MSRAGPSPGVQLLLGVLTANLAMALAWVGYRMVETRESGGNVQDAQWLPPGDFASSMLPLAAGMGRERKRVTVQRVSPVLLSDHERTLGMFQLPGYTLGERGGRALTEELERVLNAVDHRVRTVLTEEWVPPVTRLPASQKEAVLSVVLSRDGRVARRFFVRPSGSDALDSSIVAAASRVGQVLPLPQAYGGAEYELNVTFRLE
ncbi:TonB family protein [Verrucomicrobium sp. BvORR106]|uniref:TonB family protein n=1 Tax=Verrucomicrobium sp. BvORR106 TaxID=1403819 RepID=UPI00057112A9|nr:TonB family protein [Verrucomicrobium sp. BvORR106]